MVEVRVPFRLLERDLVEVDTRHLGGATHDLGVKRKTTGVAAEIEHPRVFGESNHGPAIVALIAEKAGLVPFRKVHLVAHAVLPDFHFGGRRGVGFFKQRRLDALETAEVVIHVNTRKLRSGQLVQERQPCGQPLRDAEGVNLAQQRISVAVDRQSAQPITIGADQAIGVGGLIELEEVPSQRDCTTNRSFKIALIDGLGRVTHHAERNLRARIEEAAARKVAVLVVNVDEVSRTRVRGTLAEETWKNRRLKRKIFQLRPRLRPR